MSETTTTEVQAEGLLVKLPDLQGLFQDLGFHVASAWLADNNRWPKKLGQLPAMLADPNSSVAKAAETLNAERKQLLGDLVAAVDANRKIQIEGAMEGTKNRSKAGTKAPAKVASDKKTPAKGSGNGSGKNGHAGAKTDKFGSREGTFTAKFNSALGRKAKTMTELCTEAGNPKNTQYEHIGKLISMGKVVKTDDGKYKLA